MSRCGAVFRSRSVEFKEPKLTANLDLADRFAEIGSRHGLSAGEVAIAWTLRLPAVTGAIVGARNPKQIDGIIGAGDFRLSGEEVDEIEGQLSSAAKG